MYRLFLKNIIDKLLATLILLVTLVITLPVFVLLLLVNRGKVFFIQKRPGKNGVPFSIIKFKTMRDVYDEQGHLLPEIDRITFVGKWLRKLSIDELPQLINVLKGDISLIGPRPLLLEYLPLYNKNQQKRHLVKPGMSGWAQVNDAHDWEHKLEMDVYYAEHVSFKLDVIIFLKTLKSVFQAQEGVESFEKFKG